MNTESNTKLSQLLEIRKMYFNRSNIQQNNNKFNYLKSNWTLVWILISITFIAISCYAGLFLWGLANTILLWITWHCHVNYE